MIEIATTLADARQIGLNLADSKRILEVLHKHYPGYPWAVKVQDGRASIKNLATSGEEGYAINFDAHQWSASNFEAAIARAGGEVLERFGLRRTWANPLEISELKMNWMGQVLQA